MYKVTQEYYTDSWGGQLDLTEAEFNRLSRLASYKVDNLCYGALVNATDESLDGMQRGLSTRVKDCLCDLIERISGLFDDEGVLSSDIVLSEKVGDWTVNYGKQSSSSGVASAAASDCVAQYLDGTPLRCMWI